jgi:serine kinase of HPr protein (carbohydrate metabolism regulator)
MTRVLITSMSGTGKSSALAELAQRGHRVVDADLSAWSIEVASLAGSGAEQLLAPGCDGRVAGSAPHRMALRRRVRL